MIRRLQIETSVVWTESKSSRRLDRCVSNTWIFVSNSLSKMSLRRLKKIGFRCCDPDVSWIKDVATESIELRRWHVKGTFLKSQSTRDTSERSETRHVRLVEATSTIRQNVQLSVTRLYRVFLNNFDLCMFDDEKEVQMSVSGHESKILKVL